MFCSKQQPEVPKEGGVGYTNIVVKWSECAVQKYFFNPEFVIFSLFHAQSQRSFCLCKNFGVLFAL